MGRLDVRVCGARNLADTELIGRPDPYCVVKLENQTHKTSVKDNTVNPVWDEVFKFTVADENSSQLRVELWNSNVMSDEFLGHYSLSISGLAKGLVKDGWFLLQQSKTNAELHLRILAIDFGRDATPQELAAAGLAAPAMMTAPASVPPPSNVAFPAQGYPPQQGYSPQQQGYPPQQQGYPPQQQQGYPPQQQGYPPQQQGYPPQQQGYPPQQQGYPPQQQGYPPQQQGYAPQQQGYPPQQQGYPPQQQGYAPQQGYPPQQQSFGGGGGYGGGIEIVNAWYGTESNRQDNGGQVENRLRMAVQQSGGQAIRMPGDFNREFGFDPCPGTRKQLAIHLRHNGQDHHLRFNEGEEVNWSGGGQSFGGGGYGGGIEIVSAWYGTESNRQDNGGQVQNRLRMAVQQSGGQAIRMPGDFNREFGFDPCPGTRKELVIHLRHNGQDHHVRYQEGEDINWFPGCGHY